MGGTRNLAATLGDWSARHRKSAVLGWLLLVVLAAAIGGMAGQVSLTGAENGVGESRQARQILADAHITRPSSEMVLIHSDRMEASAPEFRATVADLVAGVRGTGQTQSITDPYRAGAISADRHDALLQFAMRGADDDAAAKNVEPVQRAVDAVARAHPNLAVSEFGDASGQAWVSKTVGRDFGRAEWTAVPLALGILLVAFGALLAAVLPVLLALSAFIAANGLLAVASHALHVDSAANSVMLLIGLAVGVDYCMFYLRREREERAKGRDRASALRIAAATSGRSVLVSGLTVMVAMAGMFLSGLLLFDGFAVATILVVLIAMVGSVTVLPALLSMLGDRVEFGRIPLLGRLRRPAGGSRLWSGVLRVVLARPAVSALVAGGALLVLAAPAIGMHTEQLGPDKQLPANAPLVTTFHQITKAFPGGPVPAHVVVKATDIASPQARAAIAAFQAAAVSSGAAGGPATVTEHRAANVADIAVPLAGTGEDARSKAALAQLRTSVVPATLGHTPGLRAAVGGDLASSVDFNAQLKHAIVPVFVFVMGIAFLVMLVSFRSVTVAATAIGLNLLSICASYGVMVAVFQHGWGASLIHATPAGAIESWMPLFVFVVLFGLSMDYHVFVVSRISEARERGLSTRAAVSQGIRGTAGVVTSAAVIMVAIFAIFGSLSMQDFKQLGVGLAVAVLLDATVVRGVLLPSVMTLLGDRNWYLPRWLGWLPRISHGEEPAPVLDPRSDRPRQAAATGS
jgi:RND superfamily putative drug exporter